MMRGEIIINKAYPSDFDNVVKLLDDVLTVAGYGFCNKMQVKTELDRGSVFVARTSPNPTEEQKIIGVRIGFDTIYNLAVHPDWRNKGIGKKLIFELEPTYIRVKSKPIGHLSKKQLKDFVNPEPFYERVGFVFSHNDYGRNFFQNTNGKAQYHTKGKEKHIAIFRNKKQTVLCFDEVTT